MLGLGSKYNETENIRMGYGEYKKYFSDCETVSGSYIGGYEKSIMVIVPQIFGKVTAKIAANGVTCYYVDGKRVRRERVMRAANLNPVVVREKVTDTSNRTYRENLDDVIKNSRELNLTSRKNKNGSCAYFINGFKAKAKDVVQTIFWETDKAISISSKIIESRCKQITADTDSWRLLEEGSHKFGYSIPMKLIQRRD